MVSPPRALLSVSDKEGLVELARGLRDLGFELIGTDGTAKALKDAGLSVTTVADYTGLREGLGGRVKTLHPRIFAGILAPTGDEKDLQDLGAVAIDLVIVNLYPFEATVAKPDVTADDAVENIDIGGVSLIRAAAKNASRVGVLVNPARYRDVLQAWRGTKGRPAETPGELAPQAVGYTSPDEAATFHYLASRLGGHGRREPKDRPSDGEGDEGGRARRGHRPGVRAAGARDVERKEERDVPHPPDAGAVSEGSRGRHGPRTRRRAPADNGISRIAAGIVQGRDENLTDRRSDAGRAVRDHRESVREIEFDRPCAWRTGGRHRRGSDESGRRVHACLLQGERGGSRERRGERRLFPVPGRPRRIGERGRRRDCTTGRFDPRCGSDRGRR